MRITLGFNFDKVSGFLDITLLTEFDVGMKEKGNENKPEILTVVRAVILLELDGGITGTVMKIVLELRVLLPSFQIYRFTRAIKPQSILAFADYSDEIRTE